MVELQVALFLLLVLTGLALLNLAGSRDRVGVRGLAQVIAGELKVARQLAMARGEPVGMAFPSLGGSTPLSQGFYQLRGESLARLVRVRNFAGEFPRARFGVCSWAGSLATTNIPTTYLNESPFDPLDWGNPVSLRDPLLIFLPSGRVTSNGWPRTPEGYHLLVGNDFGATAGANDASSNVKQYEVVELTGAYDVVVSPIGQIRVESAPHLNGRGDIDLTIAPLPKLTVNSSNEPPELLEISFHPVPRPEALPDGVDAVVRSEQLLTLTVRARDVDGDSLFLSWHAEGGAFSSGEPMRMEYVPEDDEWALVSEWSAPESAAAGALFGMRVTVEDRRGDRSLGTATASRVVAIAGETQVVFGARAELSVVPLDGTSQWTITDSRHHRETDPLWSPNGALLLYRSRGSRDLYVLNSDGTRPRILRLGGSLFGEPCWTTDSSQVVAAVGAAGSSRFELHSGSGLTRRNLGHLGSGVHSPHWRPQDSRLAFIRGYPGGALVLWDSDTDQMETLVPSGVLDLTWEPFGEQLFYTDASGLHRIDIDTNGLETGRRYLNGQRGRNLSVSHDGASLLYNHANDVYYASTSGGPGTNVTNSPQDESGGCFFAPSGDIIFDRRAGSLHEIYRVSRAGTDLIQMTDGYDGGRFSVK